MNGISWRIRSGEHWALLGANGSGKTTLLKILTGYEWPTAGSVRVLGRTYGHCDIRAHRKMIGWVSSSFNRRIPSRDSVLEVAASGFDASIGLYREIRGGEWARAEEVLESLGMAPLGQHVFSTLSQGEQQRAMIARAVVNDPAILVLDEPCAGLDPVSRVRFLDEVAAFTAQDSAPTVILVTHHIEEIRPWITHAHLLKNGQTLLQGTTDKAITSDALTRMLSHECEVEEREGIYRLTLSHTTLTAG
ncbi:MAG: ATP-binding cassette domain-containing protein [Candidatus Hydrogenedentes bacterium]|nr:ATP-binding cassette domain-containing protein [Candidatus Hydrogenedentota bacterium]